MSRIGRKPIDVPSGVNVAISGNHITVKGNSGKRFSGGSDCKS